MAIVMLVALMTKGQHQASVRKLGILEKQKAASGLPINQAKYRAMFVCLSEFF
jgi:hypothetical protein